MKMYKTGGWKELIEIVEPIKVSEKSVWLDNGRSLKRSEYANYWDTLEEAKQHLKDKFERIIEKSENRTLTFKEKLDLLSKY